MNRIQQDNGRQSQADTYRNDGMYRGEENGGEYGRGEFSRQSGLSRGDGPVRYGDSPSVRYNDDPRWAVSDWRNDESRGSDRGDSYRSGGPMRREGYGDSFGYQERGRGAQGYERERGDDFRGGGRGYDAPSYGRGGRDERSHYGAGRREAGFDLADWDTQRGRSFTGESYGGSFAGPYAPHSSWDSRAWRSSREDGAGSSFGSMGSMGSFGSSGYAGRQREDSWGGSRAGSSSMMERESYRGRGPKGYQRADQRIQEDLQERLTDDGDIDANDIEVSVKEGEITLNGTVSERSMKRRAEDLAEAISGSRHVQNNLRVKRENAGAENKDRSASGSEATKANTSSTSSSMGQGQTHSKGNATSGNSGANKN